MTCQDASALVERHWGLRGDIRALPSYTGRNFRLSCPGGEFVFKAAFPPCRAAELDMENRAMLMLAEREPSLQWPRVQRAVNGEHLLTVRIAGQPCLLRLLSFVPGRTYADAVEEIPAGQRTALHESLGRVVGRLTRGLKDFRHPEASRVYDWNLMQLPGLSNEVANLDDSRIKHIVETNVQRFCDQLPRWKATLPIAVLHNDANDLNVIVSDEAEAPRVISVIDFGDMCTSFRLADLAIACAYAMQHESDPLACAQAIARGYLAECPLQRAELDQLRTFILARLCQSILMAARASREQPGNPAAFVSQRGVRALLFELAGTRDKDFTGPFPESLQ